MLAWQRFGNGETPESSGMKGDHLVGKYYVEFDKQYKQQVGQLMATGTSEKEAGKTAPLLLEAQEMLRRWEAGDAEVHALWQKMNGWVYQGFEETYQRLGVDFDKIYYESNTYIAGKALVEEGLHAGIFYRKEDGSVWVNLTDEGLDEKLLLRADGTSVYMTQDLGTAQLRYNEFHPQKMVYIVGNEQDYHFNVLKLVLAKKLHKAFGEHIFHLSYGMVELPEGKMKSREGTVVDADDLMNDMFEEAKRSTEALGKNDYIGKEANRLYEMIGIGALKYFILKVDPKKNMLFNPNESIDFNGNTAPFIQYTYARIASLLRKATESNHDWQTQISQSLIPETQEINLLHSIYEFPQVVKLAGNTLSPALIANYVYELSKAFNRFYQEIPIFKEQNSEKQSFRLQLSQLLAITIKNGMSLLGIGVPERM
jgi:arginyl-tRNA synthetase